ncbi:MAG: type IV pilus twitching motility protein PilT [Cyanobacteria bacterium P01_C01_bin.89]
MGVRRIAAIAAYLRFPMKILQAPNAPVQMLHRFVVAGVATAEDAGKPIIISLDGGFKMTGPRVAKDGTWRLDLVFPRPGNHHLAVSVNDRQANWSFQVIGDPENSAIDPQDGTNGQTNGHSNGHLTGGSTGTISGAGAGESGAGAPIPSTPIPQAERAKGAPTLRQLVEAAFKRNFSDIHLGVGKVPRFRVRGNIEATEFPEVDDQTFLAWMQEVMTDVEIHRFRRTLDYDGAAQYPFARVRINVFQTLTGPSMVLRIIPLEILSFDQLNLPVSFIDICQAHKGLILVTGPTGSGKSTTLAAMIDHINRELPKHIITIEDPIEFVHSSRRSLINQREVGIHSHQFDAALKSALREDPDVILIGEMRDRSTVETALKAAQTGHLVFGTLHTNGAVKTIERILALYQPDERETVRMQFAESLVAVISQGLVPTTDNKRAPFHEVLVNTDAIRDYIKRGEIDEVTDIISRSDYLGMFNMNQSLYRLYLEGKITEEIALEFSPRENEMAIMLRTGVA